MCDILKFMEWEVLYGRIYGTNKVMANLSIKNN